MFLSRVVPKKNLLAALFKCFRVSKEKSNSTSMARVKTLFTPNSVKRNCGAYLEILVSRSARLCSTPKLNRFWERIICFFFPTLGENYGHVIYEALDSGCPVLISDQTPWRGLSEVGAGWDLPLDKPDLFRQACKRSFA